MGFFYDFPLHIAFSTGDVVFLNGPPLTTGTWAGEAGPFPKSHSGTLIGGASLPPSPGENLAAPSRWQTAQTTAAVHLWPCLVGTEIFS